MLVHSSPAAAVQCTRKLVLQQRAPFIGLALWGATEQRRHLKPPADDLFRWLRQASEGTFLRSFTSEVPPVTALGDRDWPALLAAVLESNLLTSCPPDVAAMLVPHSGWLPAPAAPRPHRRTTRGKGRKIKNSVSWQGWDAGMSTLTVTTPSQRGHCTMWFQHERC